MEKTHDYARDVLQREIDHLDRSITEHCEWIEDIQQALDKRRDELALMRQKRVSIARHLGVVL